MGQEDFSGIATATALIGTLAGSAGAGTVVSLQNATGWPTGATGIPFAGTFGRGSATEEKILFSSRSGNDLTIAQRGYDDTVAITHQNGEPVTHTVDATVLRTNSAHVFDVTRHDHTQYARVGFANTFSAKQDVQMPTGAVALRLGRTDTANPNSLNVTPYGAAAVAYASGAEFDGVTSTARAASASQFEQLNAGFNWYTDTGLTPGNPYGRTKVLSIVGKSLQVGDGTGLSTGATSGFFGLRYMAGTPTGVPDLGLGSVVYDNVTNKLWIYNGSWRSVALT